MLVNSVLDDSERRPGGWLFPPNSIPGSVFTEFLSMVDHAVESSGFFASLKTVEDYVSAVDSQRWKLISGALSYTYALIALGDYQRARECAISRRAEIIRAAQERGFVHRDSDLRPYDEVIRFLESKG